MGIRFEVDAFCADMHALRNDIESAGWQAWRAALKDAATASTESGYKNRTGNLTASRAVHPWHFAGFQWSGEIEWTAKYAKFVDKPTVAHFIGPKKAGGYLRWYVNGSPVFSKGVWHHGTKGSHFTWTAARAFEWIAPIGIQAGIDAAIGRHP